MNTNQSDDHTGKLIEDLTERELEIVKLLRDGNSNQEIADTLFLELGTVKWYNTQIYGKLAVKNRKQAVKRAEELGLFAETTPKQQHPKHNIPIAVTPFIGRQPEITEVAKLVTENRLVNILGVGGMGKTRLSQEVARQLFDQHRDGVYFVPLAPLSNPNDIVTAIAECIGFVFHGENPLDQQLINFLKDREMLLVLDNFEHLLEGVSLAAEIVRGTADINVLVTSRERLNLRGETVYTLRGMDFPTWETPADALEYDAVKLFMQGATQVRSDFELHADELDYLARICRLTEGMPLGIELAAGWVDVLSLENIAAEIQQGIDILETELRDVPERHRSIHATFERTWNRLTHDEQSVFMKLSVFRGGFTRDAAQSIADASILHLRQLSQKALIQTEPDGRYAIHELLRQFASGKLADTGQLPATQEKHATYFADFMAKRNQDIKSDRQLEALHLVHAEFENVRVSWMYFVDKHAWEQLPKFLHSLRFYADMGTRTQEMHDLLDPVINVLRTMPVTKRNELALGRLLARFGWIAMDLGFLERSVSICEEAIQILRRYDNPEDLMTALFHKQLSELFLMQTDVALSTNQEGLRIAQTHTDTYWIGQFLIYSAAISTLNGDYNKAKQLLQQELTLHVHGDLMSTYLQLGWACIGQKQYEEARYWLRQVPITAEKFGNVTPNAMSHTSMAEIALDEHEFLTARKHLVTALTLYWNSGYKWLFPVCLLVIARVFAAQHEFKRSVEILAAIFPHLIPFFDNDVLGQALRKELVAKMEPEAFAAGWSQGKRRELSSLVRELLDELAEE